MNKKMVVTLISATWFSTTGFAANRNPASVEWVENYVQSQIASIPVGPTYTAGTGISISNNVISATGGGGTTYMLYQQDQGGIIYYLDPSNQHGLAVAMADLGSQYAWDTNNGNAGYVGSQLTGIYLGAPNTTAIIAASTIPQTSGQTYGAAAIACSNSPSVNGYGNWYLPALEELDLMYMEKTEIVSHGASPFASGSSVPYWSSTEFYTFSLNAWYQDFGTSGGSQYDPRKNTNCQVRCIRAF